MARALSTCLLSESPFVSRILPSLFHPAKIKDCTNGLSGRGTRTKVESYGAFLPFPPLPGSSIYLLTDCCFYHIPVNIFGQFFSADSAEKNRKYILHAVVTSSFSYRALSLNWAIDNNFEQIGVENTSSHTQKNFESKAVFG